MRIAIFIAIALMSMVAQSTLLTMHKTGCTTTPVEFTVDITAGKCYTLPRSGTCNTNPGCAQVLTATNRDLESLISTANCTTFSNSIIMDTGFLRYFSSANCSGIESNGPLNNPCLTVSLCNATSMATGPFQASASGAPQLGGGFLAI